MSQSSILHSSLCCIFLTWSQEAQKPGDGSIPPCCPCPQGSHLQSCTTWWQCVPSPPLVKASLLPQSSPGSQARRYPGWLTQQRVTSWQRDSRAFLCHMPAPSLLLTREASAASSLGISHLLSSVLALVSLVGSVSRGLCPSVSLCGSGWQQCCKCAVTLLPSTPESQPGLGIANTKHCKEPTCSCAQQTYSRAFCFR